MFTFQITWIWASQAEFGSEWASKGPMRMEDGRTSGHTDRRITLMFYRTFWPAVQKTDNDVFHGSRDMHLQVTYYLLRAKGSWKESSIFLQ